MHFFLGIQGEDVELSTPTDQSQQFQEKLDSLNAERDDWKIKAEKLDGDIKESRRLLQETVSDLNVKRRQLQSENSQLSQANKDLISQRDRSQEEHEKAQQELSLAKTALKDLEAQMKQMHAAEMSAAESRSVEAKSAISSLEMERETSLALRHETETLRKEKAQLEKEAEKLKAECERQRAIEITLEERSAALAALKTELVYAESKVESIASERDTFKLSAERATSDLENVRQHLASAAESLEDEVAILRSKAAELEQEAEDERTLRRTAEDQHAMLLSERNDLKGALAAVEVKSKELGEMLASYEQAEQHLADIERENDEMRRHLRISSDDDAVRALENLQHDYSEVLSENGQLRRSIADYEAEIEEIVSERDELAIKVSEIASPETNHMSPVEPQGLDNGLQALCEELQIQLQAMTRDRDNWRETAETMGLVGNAGESTNSKSHATDDSSVMSDSTAQQLLVQQALEYRERRGSKKGSWKIFHSQRQEKDAAGDDETDNSEREQLMGKLIESNEAYQQTVSRLKSEVVGLNRSLKEDAYSRSKKIEALEQENSAYELKVIALERELERLGAEVGSAPKVDTARIQSLERDLDYSQQQNEDAERKIASLQTDFEKLHRASEQEVVYKQTETEHPKTLQDDFKAKVNALEKMMLAVNQENETLRSIAQRNGHFSIESELGKALQQDDKDVKIAQLHHELIELRMQGHEKLKNQVLQLQSEKRQMQDAMEKHYQILAEENQSLLENLEMRLQAREKTIEQLERELDSISSQAKTETGR
jgi:predicted  nucleic acid-binding Zn-ribbon protein